MIRPAMLCPRCGSADVHVVEVLADGRTRVVCADPNCAGVPWAVQPPLRADVERLCELGEVLASYRAASGVPLVGDLDSRRAKNGAERAELAIRGLLEGAAA